MPESSNARQYIMSTADEIESIIDTLDDEERIKLGGEPGTPYMSEEDEYDYAKRFIKRDSTGRTVAFLDLCWASNNALSAVVVTRRDTRGQGYADELVEDMVEWLSMSDEARDMDIEKINWFARRDNSASLCLATKHGFRERDDYRQDGEWWGGELWCCDV